MGSSFFLFLAVKFEWISVRLITLSSVSSDMAANFWRAWWAWLICFLVTILVSIFTERRAESELVGLVKGLTSETLGEKVPFMTRPEFFAIISVVVLVALNLLFW
jgi:SSS family solute:Na+ symporter